MQAIILVTIKKKTFFYIIIAILIKTNKIWSVTHLKYLGGVALLVTAPPSANSAPLQNPIIYQTSILQCHTFLTNDTIFRKFWI